jgi:integrase
MDATPAVRAAVTTAARRSGALSSGVAGQAAALYDVSSIAGRDMARIVPIAVLAIAVLLGLVLRSLVAPLYLVASIVLSYLAALGLTTLLVIILGGQDGLIFILPFFMFVFLLALGEDYNILVMTRVREEARHLPLREAVIQAIGRTGPTVTSAGLILAGTFAVFAIASGPVMGGQLQFIGLGLALGVMLDTFIVRTLLVPATAVLLGRWNWWPSRLGARDVVQAPAQGSGWEAEAQAIRQHGWDDTVPATAAGDIPHRPPRHTRHLAEHIMAQVQAPASLDRWPSPEGRLVTVILIRCGLRATDACTLAFDCLLHDGQGAPYLRYYNHKLRREAAVPIDEELQAEIRAQQQRVAARWPGGHPHLFPAPEPNAGGQHPLTYYSYHAMLNRWLQACDIRDEHGDPVHLTPRQWKDTFACQVINRDVPQEVTQVLLDHEPAQMTSHSTRLSNPTARPRREQATKVNINGERVAIDPAGPLAQAQWAKTRNGLATQTLPHGYCGLPVQKSCPHPSACLTCPLFLTGPEFLPELREHHSRTLTLIQDAEHAGRARIAEMNRQVLTNLDRMIDGIGAGRPPMQADNSRHLIRAAQRRSQRTRERAPAALQRMDASRAHGTDGPLRVISDLVQ